MAIIITREGKGSAITHAEMDNNLKSFYQSSSLNGSSLTLYTSGSSITHNIGSSNAEDTQVIFKSGSTQLAGSSKFEYQYQKNLLRLQGNQEITGSLIVTGRLTAQEFQTELVNNSVIYESGSTKFGDTPDDIHERTGSLDVLGSINLVGNQTNTGNVNVLGKIRVNGTNVVTGSLILSGSGTITGNVQHTNGFLILSEVLTSRNYINDTAAAEGGVPVGGLYRSDNFILIRTS